jgi:hypothetical protein
MGRLRAGAKFSAMAALFTAVGSEYGHAVALKEEG